MSDKSDIAISANKLAKSFKNNVVLKEVSFSVQKGSIFALLGPNGAGKTTIIRVLTTLTKPDKGSAEVCGFDVTKEPYIVRKKISLTGQYTAVDDILTGKENLCMIAKLYHLSNASQISAELLEKFNLSDAANRPASTYSGGMRRKLDLAMSMACNPSVIFLDEPTTGLDPKSRLSMWKIIKNLSLSGITVFLTTQYLEEAEQLADWIAILNKGEVVAQGTAADLKKLLPDRHIELCFNSENDFNIAVNLLNSYNIKPDKNNFMILIATDGSIKQLSEILSILDRSQVSIEQFMQKSPTLEDVFFKIVS